MSQGPCNAIAVLFFQSMQYYCGVLFMTTSRVKRFTGVSLSRIYVALHFQYLTKGGWNVTRMPLLFLESLNKVDPVVPAVAVGFLKQAR